jgi:hypothetical protein
LPPCPHVHDVSIRSPDPGAASHPDCRQIPALDGSKRRAAQRGGADAAASAPEPGIKDHGGQEHQLGERPRHAGLRLATTRFLAEITVERWLELHEGRLLLTRSGAVSG